MNVVDIENVANKFGEIEFGFDMYSAAEIQTCNEALLLLRQFAALVKCLEKHQTCVEKLPEEIKAWFV